MKFRPQVQLRFRSEQQAGEITATAREQGLSVNKYILQCLEELYGIKKVEEVIGASRVPDVRGGVQNETSDKGRTGTAGAGTVQRPLKNPPANRGAVDHGIRADTGGQGPGEGEGRWLGPAHAKDCKCPACKK